MTKYIVGSSPMSLGDITENDPKIKKQALENFRSVLPAVQNSMRSTLNVEQFNNQYQLPRINSSPYSLRNYGIAKNPSFSPTEARASADVIYYRSVPNKISSNVNSRNNPVDYSSVKYDGIDAKRSYAFQTVHQEQNPLYFTENQKSSTDMNLAPSLMKKGLVNGMNAADVFRSGSFGYQHISKSKTEMYSDSSRPLGLNEPYLRENISSLPITRLTHSERIPTNYMPGSSTVNHDMRHKSDRNVLFDNVLQNNRQNQKDVPSSMSLSVVRTNQQESKSLPSAFSTGTEVISYENMRDVALSKVFKPPAVQTPIAPVFKMSNSNGGQSILPFKKAQMFSSQRVQVKQSDSERLASPKANSQSSFRNTKSALSSYTDKDIQSTLTQNGYQNKGRSSPNYTPIQMFHSQKKYDYLTSMSAIRPSETNGGRSYKGFLSNENSGIQMQKSSLSNQSKQGTHLTPRMQFAKNTLFSEHARFNLPDTTYHLLMKPSQHNARNRTDLNSSGQSTIQSLLTKNDLLPSPVLGNTMKRVHSVSPSVSGTQGTAKNSGMSSSQNRPYYLTSKKPYAFKGFTFVPTLQISLQNTEMHSGQKPFINSSSNVQYAPARPRSALSALAPKPLIHNSYEKTLFQFKDIETSKEKQPDRDQTDSFDNGPQRETVSSTEAASNTMTDAPKHHVRAQALAMKVTGTNTSAGLGTNNGAGSLQNYLKIGYDGLQLDEVQSKTSQRWISSKFSSAQNTPAQTESNQGEIPTVRSSNARFVGPNMYSASMKSSTSHENPTSELVLPIYKSSLMNKVTGYSRIGNAVIQPLRQYNVKEHEGLVNPAKEIKDRNSVGVTKSNISESYSATQLRPTSSIVIGRRVEVTQEGTGFGEYSNQNIYAIPSSPSAIYRSADVNSLKTNSLSTIYRSANKLYSKSNIQQANVTSDWTNKMTKISNTDIDLSAVGVSQASRPTSSFVLGRYVNKVSTKSNLNVSSTKTGLNYYKPVRFSDIAGSASFTKLRSADSRVKGEKYLGAQNGSTSTPRMEEGFKELLFDTTIGSSSMTSALQNETDESTVDLSGPELMPTAAIDTTTESQQSFTEEYTLPQPTVYSSEPQLDHTTPTAEDIEGTFIPTLLVTVPLG